MQNFLPATPSTTGHDPGPRSRDGIIHPTLSILADEAVTLLWWALVIIGALMGFWISEGTFLHQFAVGILMSSVTLFVCMAALECLWRRICR